MSIFLKKSILKNGQIGVWKIEEQEQFFTNQLSLSDEQAQELNKKHPKRKMEWLASRHLVKELSNGQDCIKDTFGKPFFPNSPLKLSISHSGEFAAVVTHSQSVGVDIQKITPRIRRIAPKFLRQEEEDSLQEVHVLEQLHVIWGAKEALFKAYGKKEIDFRKHLFVQPFEYQLNGGKAIGHVQKGNYFEKFDIIYEQLSEYILVYVIQKT
jgi:phosphopantetheinyl transferase